MKYWPNFQIFPKNKLSAFIIVAVFVFGLVAIIYEETHRYQDKIAHIIPTQQVALYLHSAVNEESNARWQSLPSEFTHAWFAQFPEFFTEWKYVQTLPANQYAFVLFSKDNKLLPAWLVYAPAHDKNPVVLEKKYMRYQDVLIISEQAQEIVDIFSFSSDGSEYLDTYIKDHGRALTEGTWGYIDFTLWPEMPDIFIDKGKWQLQIYPQQLTLHPLESVIDDVVLPTDMLWLQIFADEHLVWQGLEISEISDLLEKNMFTQNIQSQLSTFTAMTDFNLVNLSSKFTGPVNVVISAGDNEPLYWLVKTSWSGELIAQIDEYIRYIIGFNSPTMTTSTLPDGSYAHEYVAVPKDFEYQELWQQDQNIKIVYVNEKDYFMFARQGDNLLFGNSLKLLNRYISQSRQPSESIKNCLIPGGKGLISNYSKQKNEKNPIIVREILDKQGKSYIVCY